MDRPSKVTIEGTVELSQKDIIFLREWAKDLLWCANSEKNPIEFGTVGGWFWKVYRDGRIVPVGSL